MQRCPYVAYPGWPERWRCELMVGHECGHQVEYDGPAWSHHDRSEFIYEAIRERRKRRQGQI